MLWGSSYPIHNKNIKLAISANPKGFWLYMMQARIQKEMGDKEGAKMSANKTIEIATTEKNDDYVKMAKDLLEKL